MSQDGNFFGKLSSGWSNKLNNFGALINDPSVREKAGELLRSTAKNLGAQGQQQLGRVAQMGAGLGGQVAQIGAQVQLAHRARVKNRLDRQKQSKRQSHVKSGECDLQVGQLLYDAVPIYMRTQLWKSLLIHNETESCDVNSNVCDALYYRTLLQEHAAAMKVDTSAPGFEGSISEDVFKDCHRTFPDNPIFKSSSGRGRLYRVLRAYAIHDPEVGYCQGMNFVAGLILMHLEEDSAFCALVMLMDVCGLRGMYLPDMALLQLRLKLLTRLIQIYAPRLAAHLEAAGADVMIFASPWLLGIFSSEFTVNFSGRVMDMVLHHRSYSVVMRACLALLLESEEELLQKEDFESIFCFLKSEIPLWSRDKLNKVLSDALNLADLTDEYFAQLALTIQQEEEAIHLRWRNSVEGEDVSAGEVLDDDLARQRANDLVSLRPSVQSIMDDIMKDMVEDQDNTDDPPEEDSLELNACMLGGDTPSEPPADAHSGKVEETAGAVEGAAAVAAAAAAAAAKKVGGIGRGGPGRLSVVIGDASTESRSSTMSDGSSDPGSARSDSSRNRSGAVFRLPPPPSASSSKSASVLLGNPPVKETGLVDGWDSWINNSIGGGASSQEEGDQGGVSTTAETNSVGKDPFIAVAELVPERAVLHSGASSSDAATSLPSSTAHSLPPSTDTIGYLGIAPGSASSIGWGDDEEGMDYTNLMLRQSSSKRCASIFQETLQAAEPWRPSLTVERATSVVITPDAKADVPSPQTPSSQALAPYYGSCSSFCGRDGTVLQATCQSESRTIAETFKREAQLQSSSRETKETKETKRFSVMEYAKDQFGETGDFGLGNLFASAYGVSSSS